MIRRRTTLVVLIGLGLVVGLAAPASAGIFSHKPKPSPQRAGELLGILRNDPDEKKRAAAAEELGSYDLKTYPEIVPPLLQALNDPAPEVRHQAVQTLGKLRPVSQEIGQALEQTLANDSSSKVRMQARTTLWSYHLAGYRSPKNPSQEGGPTLPNQPKQPNGPVLSTTQEPPLADRAAAPVPAPPPAPPTPAPVRLVPAPVMQPAPPPMLQPPAPAVARPLPTSPSTPPPTFVPAQPPMLVPPPVGDLGPSLSAPK